MALETKYTRMVETGDIRDLVSPVLPTLPNVYNQYNPYIMSEKERQK